MLVVEDDPAMRDLLYEELSDAGFTVEAAPTAAAGLELARVTRFDLIITDLRMPEMDGFDLIRGVMQLPEPPHVVMITAFASIETAIRAVKLGAYDYIAKPFEIEELLLVADKALGERALRNKVARLQREVEERFGLGNIIAKSSAMRDVVALVQRIAASTASVLITGESGTGKELIARGIHYNSPRASGPFIGVNLAAVPEGLIESELFGHERGAFTGAAARKDGRFSLADGGTLFLDEIGEISPSVQVKLLRFLQEHEFERVGGTQTIRVDVRVIAATNRNLVEEVAKGRFREDLYYRLNVVALEMPPLRDRKSDIPALAKFFLDRYLQENAKALDGFAPETLELLMAYDWPGNVRELENAVERAVVLAAGPLIEPRHLPPNVRPRTTPAGMPIIPGATLRDLERYAILETLRATGGSTSKAAELLGISVRTIQYRLHEYNHAPRSEIEVVRKLAGAEESVTE